MPSRHWSRNKRSICKIARLGVIQIGKRAVGGRGVDPVRQQVDEHGLRGRGCDGRAPHLPVGFGVDVAGVERDAVGVGDGGVEGGLHVVDGLRDEVETEESVGVEVVEESCGGC